MRTVLFASCLLGLSLLGSAPAEATTIRVAPTGALHASAGTSFPCAWSVDGVRAGVSSELDVPLIAGDHTLACKRLVDGSLSTQTVSIVPQQTTVVVAALPSMKGEIIGVSVGGSCAFSVNGAAKGASGQVHVWVTPGVYSVSCKEKSGVRKTKSIVVKSGEAAVAMFK